MNFDLIYSDLKFSEIDMIGGRLTANVIKSIQHRNYLKRNVSSGRCPISPTTKNCQLPNTLSNPKPKINTNLP